MKQDRLDAAGPLRAPRNGFNLQRNISGTYTEQGTWRDTGGNWGELNGSILIIHEDDQLIFQHADGERYSSQLRDGGALHAPLAGRQISGVLYFCEDSLILEYEADLGGRKEQNTDIWMFRDDEPCRVGVIRQADRTIWFDARMIRSG